MSLSRVKNWVAEVLTFSDLNAEFNNILNNPGSLITPITFNLTFTDATYDIGASGATRPRDLFLSRNAVVGGTLTYGGVTLSNAVTGTGNMVLSASPTLTGTLTAAIANFSGAVGLTAAIPQLTLGVLNTTSGGILMYGSTSGSLTLKPAAAAGAGVTITLPATSVTLNAAGDLTGTTLAANVTASSLTSLGTLTSLAVTGAITGASYIGGAISGTTGTFTGAGSFIATAALRITDTATNATDKLSLIVGRHYTNAQADVALMYSAAQSAANQVLIGGGHASYNAATQIDFYTAANNTTTTGTSRLTISSAGAVTIPGTLAVTGAITGASYSGAVNFTSSAGTDYVVGSFTSTATAGWTTTPTATVKYTKIGNTVIMEWPGTMAGTSNATNATADAIPVALRPAAQKISNGLRMIDNGAGDVWGTTVINTDGTIAFYRDAAATNWTNSGSKTIDSGVVIYTLQ